ncbi:hypothetical protein C1T31_07120 [Hanstruepera neustonica]|uniref:Uncharacterized protein n=1 Tax=Hanstruepera neustonica TaxID=1445657 RepID=A0A2K1DZ31_9FLAO|nr:glycosyltransferase family 4 protein [Hanstruepera neustonica]PNQ73283.1 hypothetical protein C1T31_07120 [Hanstruepera neustonica]
MLNILWLSPNFNHYKARFLNHLSSDSDIQLTVLSGSGRERYGDKELDQEWGFTLMKVDVPKKQFGRSIKVKHEIDVICDQFDWIMLPAEKKNLSLFHFILTKRKKTSTFKIFSYNHEALKSGNKFLSITDKMLTKYYYHKLDRVVFYSESACQNAIRKGLIKSEKAFWANNTIDSSEVDKYYSFQMPPEGHPIILFIGRLISSKRVTDLFTYYKELKKQHSNLKLEIIGDGPERNIVEDSVVKDRDILWHGTLVEEDKIAPIMQRCSMVFVPGLSGLSINHAFAYGRPYLTMKAEKHGPELDYLIHGKNGYILEGILDKDIQIINELIFDRVKLEQFCINAKQKGEELSVENWVKQVKSSLLHE